MTKPRNGTLTRRRLLKDLSEIKAVLDVESQLMKALIRMAIARQTIGIPLSI